MSLQAIRVQREIAYANTFRVGGLYTTVWEPKDKKPLVVRFISHEGPRGVCFTGMVVSGGCKDFPIRTKNDGWVYESFKEYKE